ncbi:MAG: 4-hydroxybutyrate CoA-transferase [Ilumatobacteraceae bacterium]|jgi:acyl CoA:acetate/3-ketoacid CoA transferase beta subunit|nr:4-hydroxybutyrate CoA-transferase [Ilumatobacteraceae bacterium]
MSAPTAGNFAAAISAVRSTDTLAIPLGPGVPGGFLHALGDSTTADRFVDLKVFGALLPDLYSLFMRPSVHLKSGFFGPAERFLRDSGADVDFVPADFRRFETVLHRLKPRVVAVAGSMPEEGRISLSLHAGAFTDTIADVIADDDRVLIVECSPNFPRTFGRGAYTHSVAIDDVDHVVYSDRSPLNLADVVPNEAERIIAEIAVGFVRDGCTIQTGIGGIPTQVAARLANGDGGDYGIHSEMFTTGLMRLHQSGKVTNRKGTEFDGFSVTTFAAGEPALYEWLDGNRDVRFLPVGIVNSPEIIARNRDMVSINGAMAVDLSGQVVADSILGKQFSGIGGHEDFVSGPGLSDNGRSLVCLPSTSVVNGKVVSRILGRLPEGTVVTTPRHQVDVVITEFGAAEIAGLSIAERAHALARISHPDFRDELSATADVWPSD